MTRLSWRGPSKLADALAANRARLGRETRRTANLMAAARDHEPDCFAAVELDRHARDLNALADRCGDRPTLNGADPDD